MISSANYILRLTREPRERYIKPLLPFLFFFFFSMTEQSPIKLTATSFAAITQTIKPAAVKRERALPFLNRAGSLTRA